MLGNTGSRVSRNWYVEHSIKSQNVMYRQSLLLLTDNSMQLLLRAGLHSKIGQQEQGNILLLNVQIVITDYQKAFYVYRHSLMHVYILVFFNFYIFSSALLLDLLRLMFYLVPVLYFISGQGTFIHPSVYMSINS